MDTQVIGDANRKRVCRDIDQIETRIRTYGEHGLFDDGGQEDRTAAMLLLGRARDAIERGDTTPAWQYAIEAESLLHRRIGINTKWRWWCLHQLPLTLWLLILFLFLVNWSTGWIPWFPPLSDEVFGVPTAGLVLGALGAILRSIWWLHRQIARERYRLLFLNAHVVSPVIGALFGLFVYLLLRAGLLLLQGGTTDPDELVIAPALAFLAGYNWDWLSAQLDRVFSESAPKPDIAAGQDEPRPDHSGEPPTVHVKQDSQANSTAGGNTALPVHAGANGDGDGEGDGATEPPQSK